MPAKNHIHAKWFVLVAALSSCTQPSVNVKGTTPLKNTLSPSALEGSWHCVKRDQYIISEWAADHPYDLPSQDLFIQNDSVFFYEYPCQAYGNAVFYNENGLLRYTRDSAVVEMQHDTLVVHIGKRKGNREERYYTRSTMSKDTLTILNHDTINLFALRGAWLLEREYHDPYSGEPPIKIEYPFALPEKITFSAENAKKTIGGKRKIVLHVNGKQKPFYVQKLSFCYGELVLEPGGWYKKTFGIIYREH